MPTISDLRKLAKEYGCLVHLPDDTDTGDRLQSVTEPIIKVLTMVRNLRKKYIDELEDTQTLETEHFWTDLARSNLLIFLYSCGDNLGSADVAREKLEKQIELTLEKDPQNITALLAQSRVFLRKGYTRRVKKILKDLESIKGDKDKENLHEIICASEVAFAYSRVNPVLYRKAIEKYNAVFDLYEKASEEVRKRLRFRSYAWYIQLAKTHSCTLNGGGGRGGVAQRPSDGESSSVGTVYEKICKLLLYVIEADDAPYKGRAMILLVETFKKCSKFTQVDFPYNETPDSFVQCAVEASPNDPYVVVRCAEQLRQQASDVNTFLMSVRMFDKALDLNPHRHDALHKKGRALRSLWLETGDFDEANLHRNSKRKGNRSSSAKRQLNQGNCRTTAESARSTPSPRSFPRKKRSDARNATNSFGKLSYSEAKIPQHSRSGTNARRIDNAIPGQDVQQKVEAKPLKLNLGDCETTAESAWSTPSSRSFARKKRSDACNATNSSGKLSYSEAEIPQNSRSATKARIDNALPGQDAQNQVVAKPAKLNQGDCDTTAESALSTSSLRSCFAQSVSLQETVRKKSNAPTPVTPQTAPSSLPTLKPKYPISQGRAPMQGQRPHFLDEMRVGNPAVDSSNDESKQYLVAAEKCFREACELTHYSVCPYLIELGRALISLGRKGEALTTFETAKEQSGSGCNTYDSAYLHEQLALLRHQMLIDRKPEDYDTELDDVMNLYREAIRVAMAAKMRSKMAYYKLRDILLDRKTKDPGNKAFSMEYDVLYTTTQAPHEKTAEKPPHAPLVETLQQNEETCQTAVQLVKLLLDRNWEMDASIAFVYLAALRQAGRLDLKTDCEERRELRAAAVEIAKRLDDGDKRSDACLKSVEVFKWLIGEETMASFGYKNDPGTCTQGTFHVCVLAPSESFEPLVPRVIDILTNDMNLQVCTAFFEGNGDVFGNGPWVGIESLISQSICMCVVEDSGHRKWRLVETFLDDLLGKKAPNVFLVSDHEIADTTSSSFCQYANTWPRLAISRDPAAKHLTCALLERALDLKMMA